MAQCCALPRASAIVAHLNNGAFVSKCISYLCNNEDILLVVGFNYNFLPLLLSVILNGFYYHLNLLIIIISSDVGLYGNWDNI